MVWQADKYKITFSYQSLD